MYLIFNFACVKQNPQKITSVTADFQQLSFQCDPYPARKGTWSYQCCCEGNNISQQCALVVKAANHILGCVSKGAASGSRALIFLYSVLGRSQLVNYVQFGTPQAWLNRSKSSRLQAGQRAGALDA